MPAEFWTDCGAVSLRLRRVSSICIHHVCSSVGGYASCRGLTNMQRRLRLKSPVFLWLNQQGTRAGLLLKAFDLIPRYYSYVVSAALQLPRNH